MLNSSLLTKSQKQELLALLDTLGNIAELLPKMQNPAEQIEDCLAACECIKENIEQEFAPKSFELLKNIETALKENNLNIFEHVRKLKSAFNSEVKTKKEVLFLPYKISMWDSLESIYLAAKEAPDWDAFVMPIPYYDKKGGKLTELHWEINYPKNIPVIDFKKYNIEERHPDIIFIHNPYDGYNIVTSVAPDFYGERLRNFTDCLVYVPYFVGNGERVQEHFCTLPACIFAHKVILQTEKEREIYINEYKKFAKANTVYERFDQISNKFLALGSPKLDKVINAKQEDYEVPQEWEKIIRRGDFKSRPLQIIFYNTSIGALLEHSVEDNKPSNKYLQKLKSVFEFFKKHNEAVILWRPHPLLESTIKSMRPWLEQEYAEIVNEFKTGGYGIYDDSADLNRAIAFSDSYYGDRSSVAKLFKEAGKPVTYQLFDGLHFFDGIFADENSLWFIDYYNLLYKRDKHSGETLHVGRVNRQNRGNIGIAENNNKLYFAPFLSDEISVFDKNKNIFEQLNFKNENNYKNKFTGIISFKNFVYFIPYEFPAIMRLNTNTNEVEYFSECVKEVFELQKRKEKVLFFDYCVVGNEVAVVINSVNAVMFFNMETCNYKIVAIGEKSEQYYGICFDGQNYYLSSRYENYAVKWNRQTNEIVRIKFPESFSRKDSLFANFLIKYCNNHIWLIPSAANNVYKINTQTNEVTELPKPIEFFGTENLDWHYNIPFIDENFIYAGTKNKGIVKYNMDTGELNLINEFEKNAELLAFLLSDKSEEIANELPKTKNAGKAIWEYFHK